jgi:RimJ/RimL family protein N-acetyltransferase
MTGTFPDDVPTLTDGVITLRAHAESDVDAMVEQSVDPESVEWTRVPVPYGRDDAVGYLGVIADGWRTGQEFCFAVETAEHAFAGSVSLRVYGDDGVGELAFGLHPAARGKGICTRAVKVLLDWGFSRFEVVVWLAHVGNWASRRVAWANGFSFDGTVAKFAEQRGSRFDAWIGSLRATDDREPKNQWLVPPVLESAGLRLRQVRMSDADRFGEILFDPRSRFFNGRVRQVLEVRDGAELVLRNQEGCARGERLNWAITNPENDVMIGHLQMFALVGRDETAAQLGYAVHPDSRGRGVLRAALGILVEWAFRPVAEGGLGKRRLSLSTAASNKASRYAAEQAGFEHVATEPEAFGTGEEGFEDDVVYQRLNPNWTTESANPPA